MTNEEIRNIIRENVLTTSQVCDLLGISRQQLHNLIIEEKLIPTLKLHYGNIFIKEDVKEYIVKYKPKYLKIYELLKSQYDMQQKGKEDA